MLSLTDFVGIIFGSEKEMRGSRKIEKNDVEKEVC